MKVDLGTIDWEMLRAQKLYLVDVISSMKDNTEYAAAQENLDGVLSLIDKIQDEAVKTKQFTAFDVFGIPETLEEVTWDMVEQHYPNYSSADTIKESDILQRYYDGELHPVDHKEDLLWVIGLDDWRQYRDDLDKGIKAATMEAMENL